MSLSNERTRLIGRLRSRRTREREGLFLVEGIRSAGEALAAGAQVRFALTSPRLDDLAEGATLRTGLEKAGVEVVELEHEELAELSDTEASQGVLLVCPEPSVEGDALPGGPLLVIDGVQDPGNVGTLLRAAAAFGMAATVVLDGTVDPFNPKAVRAAAGAIFRAPVLRLPWSRVEADLRARGPVLIADMAGRDVATARPTGSWSLVVGGEAAGPRAAVRAAATDTLAIPMRGGVESLNAGIAGAILLYALTRIDRG
jgi:TrmH family RNA methyltransferase